MRSSRTRVRYEKTIIRKRKIGVKWKNLEETEMQDKARKKQIEEVAQSERGWAMEQENERKNGWPVMSCVSLQSNSHRSVAPGALIDRQPLKS